MALASATRAQLHKPVYEGGVPVPHWLLGKPHTNTTPTIVLHDFFGAAGESIRARVLHDLERVADSYDILRLPGRNCSELDLEKLQVLAPFVTDLLRQSRVVETIRARTGLALELFPSAESNYIHALRYSEPGDGIHPHLDGNPFRGRRLAALFVVKDDRDSEIHMENEPIHTTEGSLILFEGDRHAIPRLHVPRVCEPSLTPKGSNLASCDLFLHLFARRLRHTVPPRRRAGLRLVVNALFCEPPCVRTTPKGVGRVRLRRAGARRHGPNA